MENQESFEEKNNEVVKKSWVEPEMEEINVNGGPGVLTTETLDYQS